MPKLSELTDYQPEEQVTPSGRLYVSPNMPTSEDGDYFTKPLPVASDDYFSKPVAPVPELGSNNIVERIIKKLAETEFSSGTDIGNKLAGTGGQERYQLWPEKIVRSALTAIPDAYSGKIPMHDVDPETGELVPSQAMIGRAMDMASFAGVGGLGGTGEGGVALGAGPSLRPALKYKDRLYKGKEGQQHMDVIPPHLYPEFQDMAMRGEDISHYNFGFVNDKGHFLSREDALKYGIDSGLIDPQAGKFGALTSTLMADSSKPGTAIEAMAKTAQPFYSALEHNVNAISQNKMNGEAWLGTLANKPGVKPEELDWTGLRSFLEDNKGKPVTKEQVQEHLASNKVELKEVRKGEPNEENAPAFNQKVEEILAAAKAKNESMMRSRAEDMAYEQMGFAPTKYHSYQLPGGENYHEMLMTLPRKEITTNDVSQKLFKRDMRNLDESERQAVSDEMRRLHETKAGGTDYKSSHWDEPNILAHVRMNDRIIDGKKSLHVEEIQSDWHQQGRDKGYKSEAEALNKKGNEKLAEYEAAKHERDNLKGTETLEEIKAAVDKVNRLRDEVHNLTSKYKAKQHGVPDAPFKKTWHELALKRMLREAAEKGYDRLSWTPGEAQAARYDLSKNVDKIAVPMVNADGTRSVRVDAKGSTPFKLMVDKEGKVTGAGASSDQFSGKPLSDVVGKEMAEKIMKLDKPNEFSGDGLKIGGEGMKGFYDQIIPKALEKIGKEHGVKVQKGEVAANAEGSLPAGATGRKLPVHYIDIPQSLKDRAMHKGFPLFSSAYPSYSFTPVSGDPFKKDKK